MSNSASPNIAQDFRQRLIGGDRVVGTFAKTPTGHAAEIFGDLGFDFVVADQEHAPFGRREIDEFLLATRASNIAGIVRVPSSEPTEILQALDCCASGVMVPHIASASDAKAA